MKTKVIFRVFPEAMFRYDENRIKKFKPRGFNTKVWIAMVRRAENDKVKAGELLKDGSWFASASEVSRKAVCREYSESVFDLAKESYTYLKMRAFGTTSFGAALDPSMKREWESLSGRKVPKKQTWKYDHTIHITSVGIGADGKTWTNWLTGKALKQSDYKRR